MPEKITRRRAELSEELSRVLTEYGLPLIPSKARA
jgi:hypothetical protein